MQQFIQSLIAESELLQALPQTLVFIGFQLVFCLLVFGLFVMPFAAMAVFFERRISGRIQSRVGPNRTGPQGLLQSIADGIKLLLKEDIIPTNADQPLFRLAPYLVLLGMLLSFVAIPFSSQWVIADFELGIFYLLAVESLVVVGVVMSGWASNNKWSLLGGMRSAAQIISYEVPVSLTILLIIIYTGETSVQSIIGKQGFWPWEWLFFKTPFTFIGFFVFFIGALAEGNRTPFDLPEAESELVSGFNTEYSGFRFSLFFLAEFANLYIIGAISTILFFGGWHAGPLLSLFGVENVLLKNLIEMLVFMSKSFIFVFIIIQLRWTVPRVRVDQLMSLCWKYLVPVALANIMLTALWMIVSSKFPPAVATSVAIAMSVFGFSILGYFFYRVVWHLKFTKADTTLNPLS